MNKKQYYITALFFFILQFFLIWFQTAFVQPYSVMFGDTLSPAAYYQLAKSAMLSSMIVLCMPLAILFAALGKFEKK
jgi:hypothetical protein